MVKEEKITMRSIFRYMLVVMAITVLFPGWALGAGLWVLEMANPDIGTASAGRGATAADASVAMFNPAGMTKLDRSQLFTGIQGSWLNVEFDVDESTFGGGDGGSSVAAGVYFSWRPANPWLTFLRPSSAS